MGFAPRQDWVRYREMTRANDEAWARSLSVEEKFAIYADLFNLLSAARQQLPENTEHERIERWQWKQKLAERERMLRAFQKLDSRNRERTSPCDPR